MFKNYFFILTIIFAHNILANPDPMYLFFQTVVKSAAMTKAVEQCRSQNYQLSSITQTMTNRCPGCFGFEAIFKHKDIDGLNMSRKFETRLNDNGKIEVQER